MGLLINIYNKFFSWYYKQTTEHETDQGIHVSKNNSKIEVDDERVLYSQFDNRTVISFLLGKGNFDEAVKRIEHNPIAGFHISILKPLREKGYNLDKLFEDKESLLGKCVNKKTTFEELCTFLSIEQETIDGIIDKEINNILQHDMNDGISQLKSDYNLDEERIKSVAEKNIDKMPLHILKQYALKSSEEIRNAYFSAVSRRMGDGYFSVDDFLTQISNLDISHDKADSFLVENIDKLSAINSVEGIENLYGEFKKFGKACSLKGMIEGTIEELSSAYDWDEKEKQEHAKTLFYSSMEEGKFGKAGDAYAALNEGDKKEADAYIEKIIGDDVFVVERAGPIGLIISRNKSLKENMLKHLPVKEKEKYLSEIKKIEHEHVKDHIKCIMGNYDGRNPFYNASIDLDTHLRFLLGCDTEFNSFITETAINNQHFIGALISNYHRAGYHDGQVEKFITRFGIERDEFDTLRELKRIDDAFKAENPRPNLI